MKSVKLFAFAIILAIAGRMVGISNALAYEQERITSFDSGIVINQDSSLTVTENIRVYANGNEIKRGIYRDFPTKYKDAKGLNFHTTFEVLEVLRDGNAEDHHTENLSNGIRLYIGNSGVYLDPGYYLYTIKYKTKGQLGFFKDHDELYYNVTGNGWSFTIGEASTTVQLPSGVTEEKVNVEAYTGPAGSKGTNYSPRVYSAGGNTYAEFRTTALLNPGEGLTIVAGWPKGLVNEPTLWERALQFVLSNIVTVAGVELLVIMLTYYLFVWLKYGRDPGGAGTVVPQFDTNFGISPAGVRYIHKMGFDNKILTAALVSMAIKGYIKIIEDKGKFSIELVGGNSEKLTEEETSLGKHFFSSDSKSFTFKQSHSTKISAALTLLNKTLEKIYIGKYFRNNISYSIFPVALTLLFGAVLFFSFGTNKVIANVLFPTMILLNFFGGIAMKARTVPGRQAEDRILGLKEYLTAVEKPRYSSDINLETPDSLKIYEKYLPYAIALDVEPIWTERFKEQIDVAQVEQKDGTYNTYWFHGSSFYTGAALAGSLGGAFTSVISSSSTPPGSHSGFGGGGGGGGHSGGGGGGGGGGGW